MYYAKLCLVSFWKIIDFCFFFSQSCKEINLSQVTAKNRNKYLLESKNVGTLKIYRFTGKSISLITNKRILLDKIIDLKFSHFLYFFFETKPQELF